MLFRFFISVEVVLLFMIYQLRYLFSLYYKLRFYELLIYVRIALAFSDFLSFAIYFDTAFQVPEQIEDASK